MSDRAVEVATAAGNAAVNDLSVISLISQADIVVKLVMLLLVVASIASWSIIFDKWKKIKANRSKTIEFEKDYKSSKSFSPLYSKVSGNADNPMAAMFSAGMFELNNGILKGITKPSESLKEMARERIYYSIQRIKNSAVEKMEKDLIFLATVGSAAPFIGLFGTVWGIVNSFQAIAATKNTTLAVVAPGIAEALLATAIGLFAAIPAVIFYNLFSNEIRKLAGKLEDFSGELSTLIIHQVK